ncbi:MAG TPA: bifunctional 3,4-dihydroxy-2-butanone-4-phosphate synthase/GTP cyclohydrolase II [Candidatus Dormibacteraeota bacterium]|nr:bifunctional 3,4-dihydroxy-2-butanone-4-phosphate synthase/GTP cyclohydrolase II [Candidatus Dormibacteraeota bacterium]
MTFASIETAIDDIGAGRFVVIVDDEQRENEGDLAIAADRITAEQVNFMLRHARGMICVALEGFRLDELGLTDMVDQNTSHHGTAFTVSVDAVGNGVTTGISAYDRAVTIRSLADREFGATAFAKPGHSHPLRARRGGVLERAGHTEAIVDLCKAAGREPAGVICEILNEDGSMARRPDLEIFAKEHGFNIVTIDDLIAWRRRSEQLVRRGAETVLPTRWGRFRAVGYEDVITHQVHVALVHGDVRDGEPVLVRVHSECLTGDVFGSQRCDCQAQLHKAMEMIGAAGSGVIVYLRQEGRGIGLLDKLRAYALQDSGLDTVQANEHLGLPADKRDYGTGAQILADLGIRRIRAISNNPRKWSGLRGYGLEVVEQVPLVTPPTSHNIRYLRTKRDKMGHALDALDAVADAPAGETLGR